MVGRIFGGLRVLRQFGTGPRGVSWLCVCKCGKEVKRTTFQLEKDGYGSCGCSRKPTGAMPVSKALRAAYGITVISWRAMFARCRNETGACYKGIDICSDWFSFENFLRDMGSRPSINHSIDRIDPDDHYYKENCRWLTKTENSSRIRRNLSAERNENVSRGLKRSYAEGRIVFTEERRQKIGLGGAKRVGRKLQKCTQCGANSYLALCQKCRKGVTV